MLSVLLVIEFFRPVDPLGRSLRSRSVPQSGDLRFEVRRSIASSFKRSGLPTSSVTLFPRPKNRCSDTDVGCSLLNGDLKIV